MKVNIVSREKVDDHISTLIDWCEKFPDQVKMVIRSPQPRRRGFYTALENEFGVSFQSDVIARRLGGFLGWLIGCPVLLKNVPLEKSLALCSRLMEQSMLEVLLISSGFEDDGGNARDSAFLVYMVDEDSAEVDGGMVECWEVRESCPASIQNLYRNLQVG